MGRSPKVGDVTDASSKNSFLIISGLIIGKFPPVF
jgi:hypothetical protein